MLTDKQIDALVNGIRSWAKVDVLVNNCDSPTRISRRCLATRNVVRRHIEPIAPPVTEGMPRRDKELDRV